MAKDVVVKLGDEVSALGLSRLTREKLYGRKRRLVVDTEGVECSRALLTTDGATLVPSSGLTSVYLTPDFDMVERSGLKAVHPTTEEPLQTVGSTLGVEQALEGPIAVRELLDCTIKSVYQLDGDALGETLRASLEEGHLYKAPFSYRSGYGTQTLFLVMNEQGLFGLLGEPMEWRWCEPDEVPDLPEESDDDAFDESDLDFEMF
ncbi:MAG: hypothetical protein AAFX99_27080 [Myxococcota bacterium]